MNLRKGDTLNFKKENNLIQLFFEHGRYFIISKNGFGQFLESFNTLREAKVSFNKRKKHLQSLQTFENLEEIK